MLRISIYVDVELATRADLMDDDGEPRAGLRFWVMDGPYMLDKTIGHGITAERLERGLEMKKIWVEKFRRRVVRSENHTPEKGRYEK